MRAAVLGTPVSHSRSPAIHNAGYAAAGLRDWTYTAIECDTHELPGLVAGLEPDWAGLSLTMPLKEVARECGISVGHFSHAFRHTLGVAPHKWLIEQRVALSKEKLRDGRLSLSDVAAECGFSDQSHLARHFQRIVGVTPGAWRRALKR